MSRITGGLPAACAWLAMVATASIAAAQAPDAFDDEPAPAEAAAKGEQAAEQLDANVEQWILGGERVEAIRNRLEAALVQDIRRVDGHYSLSPAQRKKLELAGGHDIKRYFDRIDEVKSDYRRSNGDWDKVGGRVFELQRIRTQPHSELFGNESLFAKTLRKNLTVEQVSRYDRSIYRKRVEWMAGLLHGRLVFTDDQRRRFVDLVSGETAPLKRYGSFDYDAIMLQISRLRPERLRTVLHESQCRELNLRFDQARRMESLLLSEGYLSGANAPAGRDAGAMRSQREEARR